jgi:hypothetical protein
MCPEVELAHTEVNIGHQEKFKPDRTETVSLYAVINNASLTLGACPTA